MPQSQRITQIKAYSANEAQLKQITEKKKQYKDFFKSI